MTTRIRTAFAAARARRADRHLAGISFSDGCAQVFDAPCRASKRRRQSLLSFAR
ncbi:hypothetical protein ABZ153_37350 [Streptomyces sp. NPDC006290]|uniref:hypothetical protein n=1 Tax=Streptomyces sp. NPDC006290 TaxID=3156745 RepID=UPI0033B1179B